MIKLINKQITIKQGNTGGVRFRPCIKRNGKIAGLSGFNVVLTVKKSVDADEVVLTKTATDGQFIFLHDDTKGIEAGEYVYDILVTANDQYSTIGPYKFVVEGVVNKG